MLWSDANAPNIEKFTWHDSDWCPECSIFYMLERYLGSNLPGYYWRGYVEGRKIADVNLHREDLSFTRSIELVENWREILREGLCIHFLHESYKDKDKLPETITSGYYSFDEAEELFSEQRINLNKNQMDGKEEVFVKEGINLLRIGLNTEDVIRFIGLVGLYPEQAKNIEMSMGIWGPGVDD